MKELRMSKDYFVCKSVNVLSKLLIKGFVPAITKQSDIHEGVWLWYFRNTDALIKELKDIFDDCKIVVIG